MDSDLLEQILEAAEEEDVSEQLLQQAIVRRFCNCSVKHIRWHLLILFQQTSQTTQKSMNRS
jgi:hypothetical protein